MALGVPGCPELQGSQLLWTQEACSWTAKSADYRALQELVPNSAMAAMGPSTEQTGAHIIPILVQCQISQAYVNHAGVPVECAAESPRYSLS